MLKFQIDYRLDSYNRFDVNIDNLTKVYNESLSYAIPKAILFSSPNDLSGRVYSREDIKSLIRWAHDHNLLIIVDEVKPIFL